MTQTANQADENNGPTTPGTANMSGTANAPLGRVRVGQQVTTERLLSGRAWFRSECSAFPLTHDDERAGTQARSLSADGWPQGPTLPGVGGSPHLMRGRQ